jgi:hypothetical protein
MWKNKFETPSKVKTSFEETFKENLGINLGTFLNQLIKLKIDLEKYYINIYKWKDNLTYKNYQLKQNEKFVRQLVRIL